MTTRARQKLSSILAIFSIIALLLLLVFVWTAGRNGVFSNANDMKSHGSYRLRPYNPSDSTTTVVTTTETTASIQSFEEHSHGHHSHHQHHRHNESTTLHGKLLIRFFFFLVFQICYHSTHSYFTWLLFCCLLQREKGIPNSINFVDELSFICVAHGRLYTNVYKYDKSGSLN